MLRKAFYFLLIVVLLDVAVGLLVLYNFNLSALPAPGRIETYAATLAKRWLVARNARGPLPPAPARDNSSIVIGQMIFGGDCASCHGVNGRTPTDIGRSMYPRVLDLGSPEVQRWSDAELFWIIKNGTRLSGMPGFGRTRNDEQIWDLVYYVRSLAPPKQ